MKLGTSLLATCLLPLAAAAAEAADSPPELGFITAADFLHRELRGGCDAARGQITCGGAGCCVGGAVCTTQSDVQQCACPDGAGARCACPRGAASCVHDHVTVCCPEGQVCDRANPGFCKTRDQPASPTRTNTSTGAGTGGGTAAPSSTVETDTVVQTDSTTTSDLSTSFSFFSGSGGTSTGSSLSQTSATQSPQNAGSSLGGPHSGTPLLAGLGIVLAFLVV